MNFLEKYFLSFFGTGLLHPAPGSWGSFFALIPGVLLLHAGIIPLALATFGVSLVSLYLLRGYDDKPSIVIDEVIGMWLTLLFCSPSLLEVCLAFVLFRFFDILKPWPISLAERKFQNAFGIIFDDILAGLAAGICLTVIKAVFHV